MRHTLRGVVLFLLLLVVLPGQASAQAAEQPVVRVGTEGTYPPFSFHDPRSQELTGYDIEVIKAIAGKAGWKLEFVETQWDAIFPALDARRIDLIANQVSVNDERKAKYGLSSTYTYSRGVVVRRTGDTAIKSLADLNGKTTAQSSTSNWAKVAKDAGAKVEAVEGFAQAAALLAQGRVDAIVNDNIAVLDYLASTGSTAVEIAGNAGDKISEQALTFRKSDETLLAQANQAITALQADGTLSGISQKYFKANVSVPDGGSADLSQGRGSRSTWEVLASTAWPMFVGLVEVTIPLTALSFAIGLVLALFVALARISTYRVLAGLARAFISIIRGTPLLLQLFIVFYGLPQLGLKFPPFAAAVIAFSLNVAGYAAEVVRSAILSVPKGQFEAAATIGLDYTKTLRRIILPQAARTAVPPLSNTLLSLVKDTSLGSVVLLTELFRQSQLAAAESNEFLALYSFAGLYYWLICVGLSAAQKRLEIRLNRYVST
ncbi:MULTISPECIES: ABC transporter substrate-binding protein/permease [unclassified Crossiella]|uniref:ABC transporter substrate-binding protein/permease n=1 Tax=unclassified Crossiella TaxID=2620835 RepID=UPI001FFFB729|nr:MULTISPECIES: ABC transporter substrate-binding protein/permease [unclassified Crossiella]MCK2244690.1 ABC transporter substrate-binding protein/permease [Crossiella sp. S99.2]MCK2258323.1 ABC transporter substrate-binding protein/permease [Crossiella sp. S99.1]